MPERCGWSRKSSADRDRRRRPTRSRAAARRPRTPPLPSNSSTCPRSRELAMEVEHDRRHAALVRLARAVDVEVAEARDRRGAIGERAAHALVEQELRVRVDVERALVLARLDEGRAGAVDRRARRVVERHVVVLAVLEQRERVAVVVAHHERGVAFHRVRARALVDHRLQLAVEVAVGEAVGELVGLEVVGDVAVGEVGELVAGPEAVDRDHVAVAARVQRLHDVGADEARGAGDDDGHAAQSTPGRCGRLRWRGRARAARARTTARSPQSTPRRRRRPPAGPRPRGRPGCPRAPPAPRSGRP